MKRRIPMVCEQARRGGALLALLLTLCTAMRSQAQAQPDAESEAQPQATDVEWQTRYQQARNELVRERFVEAQRDFEALATSATNDLDRRLARELATVARKAIERREQTLQPSLRTPDELATLYATALLYGLGTSGWLVLQLQPQSFGGALLPFALLAPAAVGAVALGDSYRPLRHGIPHAIVAGMYLGFGEGLWIVGYQHAYASHNNSATPWGAERISTALWVGSTVGAALGGLVGALRRPTPGRVSFTASAGLWGGMLSALASSAIESNARDRAQTAYLAGAIGYNVGLFAGLAFGPDVAPSVARVRFLDLGGIGGALLGAGGYALASNEVGSRGSVGAISIGGALGLALAWWATSGMPADRSHDKLRASGSDGFAGLRPMLMPMRGGFTAAVSGTL